LYRTDNKSIEIILQIEPQPL